MDGDRITVFLADDNTLVREGVKALLSIEKDIEVVGTAEDYDGLVEGATAAHPQVVVSDIRMPPNFQDEGIVGCKEVRKRNPGTGIVILSSTTTPTTPSPSSKRGRPATPACSRTGSAMAAGWPAKMA